MREKSHVPCHMCGEWAELVDADSTAVVAHGAAGALAGGGLRGQLKGKHTQASRVACGQESRNAQS